jgi:hypothetical protein
MTSFSDGVDDSADLRLKIRDLKRTLAAVVLAAGGEVRVSRRHRVEADSCELLTEIDVSDDNVIVKARDSR